MSTLLLDQAYWDLCVDASGNIAVASEPYSLAQDVASACRLFLGELWYDTDKGIPYFEEILGQLPTEATLKQYLINAALGVVGVASADVVIGSFDNRTITGQIQFVDDFGGSYSVGF